MVQTIWLRPQPAGEAPDGAFQLFCECVRIGRQPAAITPVEAVRAVRVALARMGASLVRPATRLLPADGGHSRPGFGDPAG